MELKRAQSELIGSTLSDVLVGATPYALGAGLGFAMKPDGCTGASPAITAIAAQIIDWSQYGVWNFTMPAAGIAFAPVFSNVTVGQTIMLFCTQGSTPSTWAWNATTMTTIAFTGGVKTPTASGAAIDQVTLTCVSPGVVYGTLDKAMA